MIARVSLQLSVPVLLSTVLCTGASLEHGMFKTHAPQQIARAQGGDECSSPVLQGRSQAALTTVEGDASRLKARNRTRGQIRKQRASESRHSSFTTQYEYAPVPSGI